MSPSMLKQTPTFAAILNSIALAVVLCSAVALGQAVRTSHDQIASVDPIGQTPNTAQTAGTLYRITGTLISRVDGSPVPHGHLFPTLAPKATHNVNEQSRVADSTGSQPIGTFDADEQGRFSIPLPSAGAWSLAASARGFTTESYQQHEQFSTAIVLTRNAPSFDLSFGLSPEAEITGIVRDEAGEPIRNAQVTLLTVHPPNLDHAEAAPSAQASAETDDRGSYEFANLSPGGYRITVQATPWYAVASAPIETHPGQPIPAKSSLDPPLDATYPLTWFPGVANAALAETQTLKAGDSTQADFQLQPIPSLHLKIVAPTSANGATSEGVGRAFPTLQRIDSGAAGGVGQAMTQTSIQRDADGGIDVGGLAPGVYQVRLGGRGREVDSSVVRATEGGQFETLEVGAQSAAVAKVAIHLDAVEGSDSNSVEVSLIDAKTGSPATQVRQGANVGERRQQPTPGPDRVLEILPGRYDVVLHGRSDVYLTSISAKGAKAIGRVVTLPPGDSSLTLHLAVGRATLTGVVKLQSKPLAGAMVLLLPAAFGEAGAITVPRRYQSRTDGSFDLAEVIPGQYILIAIENGWQINWNDPSTLQRYLMHGVPIDLAGGTQITQNIMAQE